MALPFVSTMNSCISKRNTFTCKYSLVTMKKEVDFYEVLSLDSKEVGIDEIRKAYRSMALRYHPDVCPLSKREESTKMFVELHNAYKTLSDPIMRAKYDNRRGLIDFGDGKENYKERSRFEREVWMSQLSGLGIRSNKRMARKKCM